MINDLAPTTEIFNTGNIYFDNNPAVITNTTLNTIDLNTAIENLTEISTNKKLNFIVFPSPFNESTTILFDKNLNGEYDLLIYNIIGVQVKRINKIASKKIIIKKTDIGSGLFLPYLVNRKTGEQIFIEKLIAQ